MRNGPCSLAAELLVQFKEGYYPDFDASVESAMNWLDGGWQEFQLECADHDLDPREVLADFLGLVTRYPEMQAWRVAYWARVAAGEFDA